MEAEIPSQWQSGLDLIQQDYRTQMKEKHYKTPQKDLNKD